MIQNILKTNKVLFFCLGLSLLAVAIAYCGYRLFPRLRCEKVTFTCKVFSREESKGYLGRDVISAGYQPIQVCITNGTNHALKFSEGDISLKTVPADIVAKSVYRNTAGHIIGWGVGSLFVPVLLIPAIVCSTCSYVKNQKLDNDFRKKSLSDMMIAPDSMLEGMVFVAINDYSDKFTLTLTDADTQAKILCNADLKKGVFNAC